VVSTTNLWQIAYDTRLRLAGRFYSAKPFGDRQSESVVFRLCAARPVLVFTVVGKLCPGA